MAIVKKLPDFEWRTDTARSQRQALIGLRVRRFRLWTSGRPNRITSYFVFLTQWLASIAEFANIVEVAAAEVILVKSKLSKISNFVQKNNVVFRNKSSAFIRLLSLRILKSDLNNDAWRIAWNSSSPSSTKNNNGECTSQQINQIRQIYGTICFAERIANLREIADESHVNRMRILQMNLPNKSHKRIFQKNLPKESFKRIFLKRISSRSFCSDSIWLFGNKCRFQPV